MIAFSTVTTAPILLTSAYMGVATDIGYAMDQRREYEINQLALQIALKSIGFTGVSLQLSRDQCQTENYLLFVNSLTKF